MIMAEWVKPKEVLFINGKNFYICGICGKKMPNYWHTVCLTCKDTFCYDCSIAIGTFQEKIIIPPVKEFWKYWYCLEHAVEQLNGNFLYQKRRKHV